MQIFSVFIGGDQESINVSIKHVSQTKQEELINDSLKHEESMKDISHTKVAEVHKVVNMSLESTECKSFYLKVS